jgi:hypothetical protein
MNQQNNGRVNIKSPNMNALFQMYEKVPVNQCTTFRNATEGIWDSTTLSNAFFSRENIEIIQNGIRAGVYKRSNGQYVIGPQDCDTLKIVMRSVFLQNSANQMTNITQQIEQLNKMVLEYCIQQVYSEAQGYVKYVDDVSTLAVPIAHPIQASNYDRQLEFNRWF